MLKSLLGRISRPKSYEQQRSTLEEDDDKERLRLARREDTKPEILYYLADDKMPEVRRAIASNRATPRQADAKLVQDGDDEVRYQLADKIGRLAPDLSIEQREKAEALTVSVLRDLAADQLPRVRAIVSEHLKSADGVPKDIVLRLAQDLEEIVAAPVLQFSPLLSDQDLLEIVAAGRKSGSLAAIAKRRGLGGDVADAVAQTLDTKAVGALLANDSAQLREETLDWIIDNAAAVEPWHKPLVSWPALSDGATRRIASFVAAALVETLCSRNDIDAATANELARMARQQAGPDKASAKDTKPARVSSGGKAGVEALFENGGLDDNALHDAICGGDREFVVHGLALNCGLPPEVVGKALDSAKARAVVAVAWKAGLSMRTAMQLQIRIARVRPQSILNARDGIDYPLGEDEMEQQLKRLSSGFC